MDWRPGTSCSWTGAATACKGDPEREERLLEGIQVQRDVIVERGIV